MVDLFPYLKATTIEALQAAEIAEKMQEESLALSPESTVPDTLSNTSEAAWAVFIGCVPCTNGLVPFLVRRLYNELISKPELGYEEGQDLWEHIHKICLSVPPKGVWYLHVNYEAFRGRKEEPSEHREKWLKSVLRLFGLGENTITLVELDGLLLKAAELVLESLPHIPVDTAIEVAARISEWEHWTIHRGYEGIPLRPRPLQVILVYVVNPTVEMDIINITKYGDGIQKLFDGFITSKKLARVKQLCDDQGWGRRRGNVTAKERAERKQRFEKLRKEIDAFKKQQREIRLEAERVKEAEEKRKREEKEAEKKRKQQERKRKQPEYYKGWRKRKQLEAERAKEAEWKNMEKKRKERHEKKFKELKSNKISK